MAQIKYSRQREAIKLYLQNTTSHPTANTIYEDLSAEYPKISLGTVYRNLNFLVETGEIVRLQCGDECDHFDATVTPHYHFLCHQCKKVMDLHMEPLTHIDTLASVDFDGEIEGHSLIFHGICPDCKKR